jgi:uncharacterized membrane protein
VSIRPPSTALRHARFDLYRLLLVCGMLLYVLIFTGLAFELHTGMRTHRSDLGQIDQAVWNSSRGRFLEQTDNGYIATRMTDHVEPILVLISPILWLWDDVRALLLLQVGLVALGAWPLYELALRKLNGLLTSEEQTQIWHVEPLRQLTRPLALALALAYLLAPQLQSAVLTEFHAAPLAAPLILWAFWAIEVRRLLQTAAAIMLVAVVKEEMALLAAGLGVWALWRFWSLEFGVWIWTRRKGHQPPALHSPPHPFTLSSLSFLVPLSLTLISLFWFYLATFVIVPAHAAPVYGVAESGYFARYGALGDSPADILKSLITQPGLVWQIASEPARMAYLRNLLLPFGFLSLLAPELLLLSLPVLLANLLSAYAAQYYGEFHYSAPLGPYFAVSAAYGLGRLWRWLGRRASNSSPGYQHLPAASTGTMALAALLRNSRTTVRPLLAWGLGLWIIAWALVGYIDAGRGPWGGRYDPTPITDHHRLLPRFMAQIPADAAVTATAAVHPHVSHRRYVYQFPLGLDAPVAAEWALLDVTTNTDMAPGDLKARVDEMLADEWGVVDGVDGFLLLHKGAPAKTIPDAFYEFARAAASADDPVPAGNAPLHLSRIYVEDWPRWRQTKIVTEWLVDAAFDPAHHQPVITVMGADGEALYTFGTVTPPALVWHPPGAWQVGERIRIVTPVLFLPRLWQVMAGVDEQDSATHPLRLAAWRKEDGELAVLHPAGEWQSATFKATATARFVLPDQPADTAQLTLDAQQLRPASWPGGVSELWLHWQGAEAWPPNWSVFVHLRRQDQTISQQDGLPPASVLAAPMDDFRQLRVPDDVALGEQLTLVVGLYNPQTMQRADVVDGEGTLIGNEWLVGMIEITPPPVPDQACALLPATCHSQPAP